MKEFICSIAGMAGAAIAAAFGGWTGAMTTLCILMAADYITGLLVAGLFHNSPKTDTGCLDSKACAKGLAKKCIILLFVLIGSRLDMTLGVTYLKDTVCIAYILNELLSLTENAGLMGVPIPQVIKNAIEALKAKDNPLK